MNLVRNTLVENNYFLKQCCLICYNTPAPTHTGYCMVMMLIGRTQEEGIWDLLRGWRSISPDIMNRKHASLDGGFSDSRLHRRQVAFGVLPEHPKNKINSVFNYWGSWHQNWSNPPFPSLNFAVAQEKTQVCRLCGVFFQQTWQNSFENWSRMVFRKGCWPWARGEAHQVHGRNLKMSLLTGSHCLLLLTPT